MTRTIDLDDFLAPEARLGDVLAEALALDVPDGVRADLARLVEVLGPNCPVGDVVGTVYFSREK